MRIATIGLALALLFSTTAANAIDGAMTIELSTGGTVVGPSTAPGREGTIDVIALSGGIMGGGSADRCRSLRVQKRIDQTTPLLAKALDDAELADTLTIRLYDAGTQYATLRLTDAVFSAIAYLGGSRNDAPVEHVTLGYTEVEWIVTGGTSTTIICASGSAA
jgi:type VI protein secretion system component Hcp